jgi:hypothetical protein
MLIITLIFIQNVGLSSLVAHLGPSQWILCHQENIFLFIATLLLYLMAVDTNCSVGSYRTRWEGVEIPDRG